MKLKTPIKSEISLTADVFSESSLFSLMQSTLTEILKCRPALFHNSMLLLESIYT